MRALACAVLLLVGCDGELRLDSRDGAPSSSSVCANGVKCPLSSLVCVASTCVECNGDGDCHNNNLPRCDLASHHCVQCGATADCQMGSVCEPQTKRCLRGCTSSSMCTQEGFRECDLLRGYCVKCATISQCPGGEQKLCDVRTGQCEECLSDGDCTFDPEKKRCDPVTSRCVKCLDNLDCKSGEPICDVRRRECAHQD